MDNLLVRIHFIKVMIRWTDLAPWEFEFHFPGSLTSTFLETQTRHTAPRCRANSAQLRQSRPDSGLGFHGKVDWTGFRESRRCSKDTHPESYITKYTQYTKIKLFKLFHMDPASPDEAHNPPLSRRSRPDLRQSRPNLRQSRPDSRQSMPNSGLICWPTRGTRHGA